MEMVRVGFEAVNHAIGHGISERGFRGRQCGREEDLVLARSYSYTVYLKIAICHSEAFDIYQLPSLLTSDNQTCVLRTICT